MEIIGVRYVKMQKSKEELPLKKTLDAVTEAERILDEYLCSFTGEVPIEPNHSFAFLPIALAVFGVMGVAGGAAFFLFNR